MDIELLLDAHAAIGESPTWVPAENAVYWIDVKAPALHRLELASRVNQSWHLPADIGAFALLDGGREALVALRTGLFRLDLASHALQLVAPPPYDPNLTRFNEGACDSSGRFWVGTMFDPLPGHESAPQPAMLHSFTLAGGLRPAPDAAELHNGMAWSQDATTFYLSHSQQQTIFTFAYDIGTGRIGPHRPYVTVPPSMGLPDGAAIDEEGGYWCALHGGGRLHRYRRDGTLDREVRLPVSQPTMCAFAGAARDLMIVTSAAEKVSEPLAGGVFCFRPGIKGIEVFNEVK